MTERFTMYHKVTGGEAVTTEKAYDELWFDRGWRKTKPTTSAPAADDTQPTADPADEKES